MTMRRITPGLLAALLGLSRSASANNDLSDAERQGAQSPPSIDGSPANSGTITVNQGKAGYSVPITLPPGGLVPSLGLAYVGGRQETAFGAGWQLSYPSVRVRTSGRGGQPDFGVAVRYLGTTGEELVPLAQTAPDQDGDGQREALYREERDSAFVRYVELSAGGWRMDYPDGRKLTLGTTAQTRVARDGQPDHIAEWLPEVLRDPSGNEATWSWATPAEAAQAAGTTALGTAERYLTAMRWGCTACAAATSYQTVTIRYAELPNHIFDFAPGFARELELFATGIQTATVVAGSATPVRHYALSYETTGSRRLLQAVTVTGADGSGLPPVTFGYTTAGTPSTPVTLASPPAGTLTALSSGVATMDMDGDGWKDIAVLSNVGASPRFYRNRGTSTAAFPGAATSITAPPPMNLVAGGTVSAEDALRRLQVDLFDLCSGLGCEPTLFQHQGASGWAAGQPRGQLPLVPSGDTMRADLTGDGIVDLIDTSRCALGEGWHIHPDDGAGTYSAPPIELEVDSSPAQGASVLCASDPGVLAGDVNGDGLVDIVELDSTLGGDVARVYFGRGRTGFGLQPEDGGLRGPELTYTITSIGTSPSPAATMLADMNGDGLDDLLSVDAATDQVRLWQRIPGSGFVEQSGPWTQFITATEGCRVADWTASGVASVLCSAGPTSAGGWRLHSFAAGPAHLLSSVDNGQGMVTRVTYTTTARVAAAHEAAGHAWTRHVAVALPVVASTETSDGRGNVAVTTYDYADPHYEADEVLEHYGLTGFRYVAARQAAWLETTPGDPATRVPDPQDPGVLTRTFFDVGDEDYFQRSTVDCVETWAGNATPAGFACDVEQQGPLSRVVYEHSSHTNADGIVRVTVDAEEQWVLEAGPPAEAARVRTEYDYDAHNNRTAERRFGLWSGSPDDHGGDEAMVVIDYVRDTVDWVVRLPRLVTFGGMDTSGPSPTIEPIGTTCIVYDQVPGMCLPSYAGQSDTLVTRGLATSVRRYTDADLTDGVPGTMDTVETRSYTARGLPDLVTDGAGQVRDLDYDPVFGLFPARETVDPGGAALVTERDTSTAHGALTRQLGPDGAARRAVYDDLGRLVKIVEPGDTVAAPTLTRTWALAAPVSAVTDVTKDGTANGLTVVTELDGAGRTLCKRKEGAAATEVGSHVEYTGRGLAVLALQPYFGSACTPAARGAGGRTTTLAHDRVTFDSLSRPLTTTHSADGSFLSSVYGVHTTSVRDEESNDALSPRAGAARTQVVDGLGRVTAVIDDVNTDGDPELETYTTSYAYDAAGNLISVIDPLGAALFAARYDSRNRRVWAADADRGLETSTYDAVDRLVESVDARGQTVTSTFDGAARLISIATDDGTTTETTTYHYDAHPPGTPGSAGCRLRGRLAWVEDPSGQTAFCYDQRGRITRQDVVITASSNQVLTTRNTYDAADRVQTLTHPDGTKLTYTYDAGGRPRTLTVKSGSDTYPLVTGASYDAAGNSLEIQYGNGAALAFEYDARNRPTRHRATLGNDLYDVSLVLDHIGNVEQLVDDEGLRSGSFAYDGWNRLAHASGDALAGGSAGYSYDVRGNLTAQTSSDAASPLAIAHIAFDDPVRVHAVTGVDQDGDGTMEEQFAYDAAGNMVEDGSYLFSYSAGGRLTRVEDRTGATLVDYQYDYKGRRVAASYASGDAVFHLRAANAELREVGGATVLRKHIAFAGRTIGVVDGTFTAASVTDHVFLFAVDHLGAHPLVFDVASPPNVVERWAGHPYGAENDALLTAEGHGADYRAPGDPASKLSRRFQDGEIDAELFDLYGFGARVYSKRLGRFLQTDAIIPQPDDPQAWNRYAFAYNNPLKYVDPSGHNPLISWLFLSSNSSVAAGYFDTVTFGVTEFLREDVLPTRGENFRVLEGEMDRGGWGYTAGSIVGELGSLPINGVGREVASEAAELMLETSLFHENDAYAAHKGRGEFAGSIGRNLLRQFKSLNPTLDMPGGASKLTAYEVLTGSRLKDHLGRDTTTLWQNPKKGGDWDYVDQDGILYDACGNEGTSLNWNWGEFRASIDDHVFNKATNMTVIDVTEFTADQVKDVATYLDGLPADAQSRIIRIGF